MNQGRPFPRAGLATSWLAFAVLLGAALGGCDDRLPAFANPPPYDAGAQPDAGDEDSGSVGEKES